jgi:uncharacterized membrane protein
MSKARTATRWLPWRFGLFLLLTLSIPAMLALKVPPGVAVLAGFDLAALAFIASLTGLFRSSKAREMRAHSAENDANRGVALIITVATCAAILVAVGLELSGGPSPLGKVGIVATLLIAWTFSNLVFALHYAHVYYIKGESGDRGGLQFPEEPEPDYWDFAYFAFTLGMTFQTSDVSITRRDVRKVALWHSLAAFVFNLGILAFTINTLAGK